MDIIHEYRIIWDRSYREFKDKNNKEVAWIKIADESQLPLADLQLTARTAKTNYETLISRIKCCQ